MDVMTEQALLEARASALEDELKRVNRNSASHYKHLIVLYEQVDAAEISVKQKNPIKKSLRQIIDHTRLEERTGLLLSLMDYDFLKKLEAIHPNLNQREYKICLFVKLGYDTRSIARMMGISTRGLESVRYRLHRKLGRGKHQALKNYLSMIQMDASQGEMLQTGFGYAM
ncbi:conserved hypothetical protein [Pelodictyon luteolum DSM 273]|uniref:HTH luxR-type domain-containing protein n=2 Tax=Pelodictyon luteolum TaxID=1100 RepID=Q3B520_CHLL3|nr:conserved hypothetical protein [Pelodictyon luteolum DSM 273]